MSRCSNGPSPSPGASAREVELLAAGPLEALLAEIPGVDNVYSMSSRGSALVTVLFEVGGAEEEQAKKALNRIAHKVPVNVKLLKRRPVL